MSKKSAEPAFSREEINIAGKLLGGVIPVNDEAVEAATGAFKLAYAWRDLHFEPLRMIRSELLGLSKRSKAKAITAARPKRMVSIRKKLAGRSGSNLRLSQIQDLVGCRAIVPEVSQLDAVLGQYIEGNSRHEVRHTDYVTKPRSSGYRGHHCILRFRDDRLPQIYQGLKVEVQLRTKLQHAWATAVEAVGLIRNEDLKGGVGCPIWLRLFQIMGSETAYLEGAPLVATANQSAEKRRAELIELDSQLRAVELLRKYNETFKQTEDYASKASTPYYLLKYDSSTNTVTVRGFHNFAGGTEFEHIVGNSDGRITSVLVSVDKVTSLREAYPNYFMDVNEFADILEARISGQEYRPAKLGRSKNSSNGGDNLAWIRDYQTKIR